MKMKTTTQVTRGLVLLTTAGLLAGCSNMSNTEQGAVIGAGSGGVVGAVIGNVAGSTTKGAIIGAVIGGAAGAVIGNRMDNKARELKNDLPNATVERVGEGLLITFSSGILFDFDSSTLRNEARANLNELAAALVDEEEDYELMIAGHTDAVGTDSYNKALSERRAGAATTYIVSQGIDRSRIRTVGMGEAEPVDTNDTTAGQQANRRVEVAIFASEEYRAEMIRAHGG